MTFVWIANPAVLLMLVAALVLWGFARIIASNLAAVVAAAPEYQANLENVLGRAADALEWEEIRTLANVRDRFTPEISLTALISFAAASISSLASNAARTLSVTKFWLPAVMRISTNWEAELPP